MRTLASRLCTNTVSCCYDKLWCHKITVSLQHWGCISWETRATEVLGIAHPLFGVLVPLQMPIVQEQYVEFAHRKERPRVNSTLNVLNRISSPRTACLSILALNNSIILYDTRVFWHETICKMRNYGNQGKGKLLSSDYFFFSWQQCWYIPCNRHCYAVLHRHESVHTVEKLSFLIRISEAVIMANTRLVAGFHS